MNRSIGFLENLSFSITGMGGTFTGWNANGLLANLSMTVYWYRPWPRRTVGHPVPNRFDLVGRQGLAFLRWRHPLLGVCRFDAMNEQALVRSLRDNGWPAFTTLEQTILAIQPQACPLFLFSMAFHTAVEQQRPNLGLEKIIQSHSRFLSNFIRCLNRLNWDGPTENEKVSEANAKDSNEIE